MASIEGILGLLTSLESAQLKVHGERCLMVRNRNAQCLRCADVCASGAISLRDGQLVVDPEACIGCGTCATACPTCALEAVNPTDEQLSKTVAQLLERDNVGGENSLVVACGRAVQKTKLKAQETAGKTLFGRQRDANVDFSGVVQVVCLGRLDESFYVEATARGASSVTLACNSCETCRFKRGGALARKVVESAQALLASHGRNLEAAFVDETPEWALRRPVADRSFDESRRGFFADMKNVARDAVLDEASVGEDAAKESPLAKVDERGVLPQFLPTRRNRVFNSLKRMGLPVGETVQTRLWGQVSIDVDCCSSCRMCAVFCPTGALVKFDAEDGAIGVDHRSAYCVQCRMCEAICPKQAISVLDEVSLSAFESGSVQRIAMHAPTWTPNKPDSIFRKVDGMFGGGKNNTYF